MASSTKSVRLDNIKKAREVWRLKMEGVAPAAIANAVSTSKDKIDKILKYTVYSHYAKTIKQPSYYDAKLSIEKKILIENTKIKKAIKSIANKKSMLYIFLQATAAIILILVVS